MPAACNIATKRVLTCKGKKGREMHHYAEKDEDKATKNIPG